MNWRNDEDVTNLLLFLSVSDAVLEDHIARASNLGACEAVKWLLGHENGIGEMVTKFLAHFKTLPPEVQTNVRKEAMEHFVVARSMN